MCLSDSIGYRPQCSWYLCQCKSCKKSVWYGDLPTPEHQREIDTFWAAVDMNELYKLEKVLEDKERKARICMASVEEAIAKQVRHIC